MRSQKQNRKLKKKQNEAKDGPVTVTCEFGEPYVVIEEGDVKDAVSDFVMQTLKKHYLDTKTHSPSKVHSVLSNALSQLQEPSLFQKAYQWGQFLYSGYGWATCAYNLYADPAVVKFVFNTTSSLLSWVLVIVM